MRRANPVRFPDRPAEMTARGVSARPVDLSADDTTDHEQFAEQTIQAAFDRMLAAANDLDRREAGDEFVRLIVTRNSGRSEACIAALEAAKGLR